MHKDKIYVIAGGSGLLGRKVVEEAANLGATVVVADLILDESLNQSELFNQQGRFVSTDVTCSISVQKMLEETIDIFGRVDGLVNAAYPRNKNFGSHLEDVGYDDFCNNVGMNAGSMFQLCKYTAVIMKEQKFGSIVNIGSIYGVSAPKFEIYKGTSMTVAVEYAFIKAGQAHLTRYFVQYYKSYGIRLNMVSLGGLEDGQPKSFLNNYRDHCGSKGMLDAEDVTGTIMFLLSEHAKFINGQNIVVDDGWSL